MYNISTVSNLTGVNPITLRAWERRYGLIKPTRTSKGHRVYSDDDIATIKRMLNLLEQGIAVSQVGQYLETHLTEEAEAPQAHWHQYHDRMLKGVVEFDEQILEQIYNQAMSLYPVDLVTKDLLLPLITTLGQRWKMKQKGVGEEHFFSEFVRNKLGSRFHHRNLNNRGPKILAACLPGEQHELGLLLFSLAAHERDYRIILLGRNMPLDELAEISLKTQSVAITLSATLLSQPDQIAQSLSDLVDGLNIPVFIGGRVVQTYHDLIISTGAIPTASDMNESFNIMNQYLIGHLKKKVYP